jgi:hypothetical protein
LVRRQPTAPRVLAVNGQDPAIYQRFEAIGHPLPIATVRISTDPTGRWIDQPTDHLPTPGELAAFIDEDPGDEQAQLRRDEELDDLGPDDEPLWERWERWGW